MIAIIDYGMGNLRSVQKAFEYVGARAVVTHDAKEISGAEKLVLPGVGAMKPAMEKLDSLGLVSVIKETIKARKPFLGICLGFQLLFEESTEGGDTAGLGVLKGKVVRFQSLKVPHIGWNQLAIKDKHNPLMAGINDKANVYFCHSYYVQPEDRNITLTSTQYGIEYASAVCQDNIYGVQFHPEKSQSTGLKILKNFGLL